MLTKNAQRNYLSLFSLVFVLVIQGCTKMDPSMEVDPSEQKLFEKIDIVTGLVISDSNGLPVGAWGNPNENNVIATVFPNPCGNQLSFSSSETISTIWILPAACTQKDSTTNISEKAKELVFDVGDIEKSSIQTIDTSLDAGAFFALNFSSLSTGFYRLFFQTLEGRIYWINLYKDAELYPIEQVTEILDEACN